jgi:phosphoribosylpyrophosphate synthetase
MELFFWIDALRRASAESVTAVMPYSRVLKIPVLGCTASQDIKTNRPRRRAVRVGFIGRRGA